MVSFECTRNCDTKKKYLKKKNKKNIKQENKNQNISRHLHSIWFVSVWILLSICFYLKYQWNWTCTKFQINSTSIVWGCRQHSTTLTHRQTRMKERKQCLTSPPLHFTALSGVESENKNITKKKKNNAQYNYLKNNHWLNKQQFKSKKTTKTKTRNDKNVISKKNLNYFHYTYLNLSSISLYIYVYVQYIDERATAMCWPVSSVCACVFSRKSQERQSQPEPTTTNPTNQTSQRYITQISNTNTNLHIA